MTDKTNKTDKTPSARQKIAAYLKRRKTPATAREIADKCELTIVRTCSLLGQMIQGEAPEAVRDGTRCKYVYSVAA
jgi:hypothetical protein